MVFFSVMILIAWIVELNLGELIFEDNFDELDLSKWQVIAKKGDCASKSYYVNLYRFKLNWRIIFKYRVSCQHSKGSDEHKLQHWYPGDYKNNIWEFCDPGSHRTTKSVR